MAINHGYIGRAPSDSTVTVARQVFNVSGVTTDFTFTSGYDVGYLDVFINGTKIINGNDYTATDTSTISILNGGAQNGDVIEAVAYKAFNLGQSGSVGVSSGGVTIGQAEILNFTGTGNEFTVNGSTIDVNISSDGSGIGTALSDDATSVLSKIFKTPKQLNIGSGESITVSSDSSSGDIAFCREGNIHVAVGGTFHIGSGTTFITNVFGVF